MYNAMDLARLAFYAAHYAKLIKADNGDPSRMIEAANYYINRLEKIPHDGFERIITDIERMLKGV